MTSRSNIASAVLAARLRWLGTIGVLGLTGLAGIGFAFMQHRGYRRRLAAAASQSAL